MLFPRGPRFDKTKVSDVPGPNAYNIPQDSGFDKYKRGAFLDKADRFSEKMETGPERYVALQKRVDELERVHLDGKKTHHVEIEKLKHELAASQTLAAESVDKLEKQKKQKIALESTIQELKKVALSDQGEIKDLRHKLRLLELERDKSSSKQPEINELKKSLQALEAKRKDDIRDRDRKIVEFEKSLQAEKRRRELLECKNQDTKRLFEEQIHNARLELQEKETTLQKAKEESQLSNEKLRQIAATNACQEADLLQQLEHHRFLLGTVAQQYGALASQSASLVQYNRLEQNYRALQCQQYHLERKLANSEEQVVELAHLIRQVKDANVELDQQLQDALEAVDLLLKMDISLGHQPEPDDLTRTLMDIDKNIQEERAQLAYILRDTEALLSAYYHLKADQIQLASKVLVREHTEALTLAEQHEADLSSALASHEAIAARLESTQRERIADHEALQQATTEVALLRSSAAVLEVQLAESRRRLEEIDSVHVAALKKEKHAIQRLTTTLQRNHMAEEGLRGEIDRLTAELASAEGYQDAYAQLYDQVDSLIARNQIAEEEAERISKFNAEILGHQNPAQRILYVDRIRTELAETKMKMAELMCEQENLAMQNGELEHELDMYKPVRADGKLRTRVGRPPLVNFTRNVNNSCIQISQAMNDDETLLKIPQPLCEVGNVNIILDEIMY